ncbi:RibD family protein [Brevundimonas sp. 2R-24]|uniref:RibD family protein n=1 Tax=Peiella sedimenti TaxID=3061083 RepID=A0ABT8SJE6_9CAUL|nr:RibD family protein [Caulobacteraceae bacterium XZ-24]
MRPTVTLKLATSLDGRIALASGESRWITGEAARAQGHRLRAEHDAILVGVGTVLADDPLLTVRIPSPLRGEGGAPAPDEGEGSVAPSGAANSAGGPLIRQPSAAIFSPEGARNPLRVVLDSRGRMPPNARMLHDGGPTVVIDGRPEPQAVLDRLEGEGVGTVLIEGGGQVAAGFLKAGLVGRIEWFRAPIILGGDGVPCVDGLALSALGEAPAFVRVAVHDLSPDLWERYERRPSPGLTA